MKKTIKKQCPICGNSLDGGCTITSDKLHVLCKNDGTGTKVFESYMHVMPKRKASTTKGKTHEL